MFVGERSAVDARDWQPRAWWRCYGLVMFSAVCLLGGPLAAAELASEVEEDLRMAARVDELLDARLEAEAVQAAPAAEEAEFLRRAYLDLTGVVPTAWEVRQHLADESADKRQQLIEQLLHSPRHATHLANVWTHRILAENTDVNDVTSEVALHNWLRRQFADNLRYDRLVADFLVTTGGEAGPALFFTSMDLEPEKLASSTARIFLGVQLQCAECHDHPFDRWTQRDFWGYAAFFAQLERGDPQPFRAARVLDALAGEVMLPNSDEIVPPRYPDGRRADPAEGGTRRMQLAIWMSSRDNPFLGQAAVNWAWAQLFGRGLVHPPDDFGPHNPPSHPELLEELRAYFVAAGFDMRRLLRTLANTRAYQRSSRVSGESPPEELFAAMALKPLTADQLYDSLRRMLPQQDAPTDRLMAISPVADPERRLFLANFPGAQAGTQYEAGVPQALILMNGPLMARATDPASSRLLASLEAPLFTDEQRIETLFLSTLTRPPQPEEQQELLAHLAAQTSPEGRRQVLSDLLWALLNSAEFAMND